MPWIPLWPIMTSGVPKLGHDFLSIGCSFILFLKIIATRVHKIPSVFTIDRNFFYIEAKLPLHGLNFKLEFLGKISSSQP